MDEGCGNPYQLPYRDMPPKSQLRTGHTREPDPKHNELRLTGIPSRVSGRARTPAGREADTGALGDLAHVSKMATTYERLSAGVHTRLCRVSIGCTRGSSWHVELVCHPI